MTFSFGSGNPNQCFPSAIFVMYRILIVVVLFVFFEALVRGFSPWGGDEAKTARAQAEVRSIALAARLYTRDHGRLPVPADLDGVFTSHPLPAPGESSRVRSPAAPDWVRFSENVIRVLAGAPNKAFEDADWYNLNPAGKTYLSLDAPAARDPWGGPYAIRFTLEEGGTPDHSLDKLQVKVRSAGPSRRFDDPAVPAKDDDDITNILNVLETEKTGDRF